MIVDVKMEGQEKLLANLKKWQIIKRKACEDVLKEGGFRIQAQAKAVCPVDTNRLRGSISTNWSGSGMGRGKTQGKAQADDGVGQPAGEKGLVVVTGTNVFYAPFVEFGTNKMDGRPYLFPAFFSLEPQIQKRIAAVVGKDEKL